MDELEKRLVQKIGLMETEKTLDILRHVEHVTITIKHKHETAKSLQRNCLQRNRLQTIVSKQNSHLPL